MCREVGCDGFQNFKVALAQHVAHSGEYAAVDYRDDDSARQYTFKVFDATMEALKRVRDSIEVDAIEKAVELLGNARRVEFYGFGASAAVAHDAQHNFFRLQTRTPLPQEYQGFAHLDEAYAWLRSERPDVPHIRVFYAV